jgi:putative endonuclease
MVPKNAYHLGIEGERVALSHLKMNGYSIIDTRYKTPYGEIDIIACNQQLIVCVEVKTRKTFVDGLYAPLPTQQKRVMNAYLYFCQVFPVYDTYSVRFDVIVCVPGKRPIHIKQAFEWAS